MVTFAVDTINIHYQTDIQRKMIDFYSDIAYLDNHQRHII